MRKMVFLLGAYLTLWLSVPVRAETRYVGTSGDFEKIQDAIDAAVNGDTIVVFEGTYVENIRFNGKNIVLMSTDPLDPDVVANTIIDGNKAGSVVSFAGTENETCVLSGFTIKNGSGTQTGWSDTTGGGGIFGPADNRTHATIRNNIITRNTAVGFGGASYGYGGGVICCDGLIENNVITDNRASDGGGLCHCDGTTQNNVISDNIVDGWGGGLYGCGGIIQRNVISGNIGYLGGAAHSCHGTIQNNLITGNRATYSGGGLAHCHGPILDNTIVGNSAPTYSGGIHICDGVVANCVIWGNSAASYPQVGNYAPPRYCCIQDWIEGKWVNGPGIGNISADPCFVDAENGDFRLDDDSPCINAGSKYFWLAWSQRDMDGNCRLAGTSVDMGCYEYGSSLDSDGDLLCDADEATWMTNLNLDDTDGDGLRDGLEILRGSDPLVMTLPETINIPPGDGSSIQRALSLAIPGDEIVVAPGTYQANLVFCGPDVLLRSTNPQDPSSTILDGGAVGRVIAFSGHESEECLLSGLTITNGFADHGAGIYGSLCGMGENRSPRIATHATIENNVIAGNSARHSGNGISSCDGLIQNNVISNNLSENSEGGGLYGSHGAIRKNVISGNSAHNGGAIGSCHGTVENNLISGNSAYWGGGLYRCNGTVTGNIISANSATASGGGLSGGEATVKNNIISGNSANYGGGLDDSDGVVEGNVIAGNSALTNGGGVNNCSSRSIIRNNTIAGNSAGNDGGGLNQCLGTIINCIIWDNTAPTGPQLYESSTPTYSCIQGWRGGGESNISPKSGPGFVNANEGDYHLGPGSPCVDAGVNEDWMWTAFDLDGNARIIDGDDNGSDVVDMGAYEYRFIFRISQVATTPSGEIQLTWNSRPEEYYTIFTCTDMMTGTWVGVETVASGGTSTTWIHSHMPANRKLFYRIDID